MEYAAFSFNPINIIGAEKKDQKTYLFVPGHIGDEEIFVMIEQELFLKIFNRYTEEKLRYCTAYKHFCGVDYISSENYTILNGYYKNIWDEETELQRSEPIRVFQIDDFELEMEHG